MIIEFLDGSKLPISGIIDIGASRGYIASEIVSKEYKEEVLQKSLVKDAFENQILLIEKSIDFIIGINSQKYKLPLTWIKPFREK